MDGFFDPKGAPAINNGCLVIHNGTSRDGTSASMKAIFQIAVAPDATAFRFTVKEWKFKHFIRPKTSRWFQNSGVRDFVLKIEFLAPGLEGLGLRTVFIENSFIAVDEEALGKAFAIGQKLPWFAAPPAPSGTLKGLNFPLNLRVTVVETTRPNQFATWVQEIAKNKKIELTNIAQDAARKALDANFAANQIAQAASVAGIAYGEYKTAWDACVAQIAAKPSELSSSATPTQTAVHDAALAEWKSQVLVNEKVLESKRVSAKTAFSAASLTWPGDLPKIPK